MLLQDTNAIIFLLGIIIGTVILGLIIYLAVLLIESKTKASDKVVLIFLLALITILILPPVLGAIGQVLSAIGNVFVAIRDVFGGGGANYLVQLVPIIGFLILLVLTKFFIDIRWETSVWISLLTLFLLYILLSLIPELDFFDLYVI
ncbi:MAG: conserved membrane protein of unknown function [Promethearchaeota archaeon]|nr:MAG: conserved membrane protein of unknown function [Candidatus Lokiarchaeota archaeon]